MVNEKKQEASQGAVKSSTRVSGRRKVDEFFKIVETTSAMQGMLPSRRANMIKV